MTIRIVRLGSARVPGEGVRIGTVRRPPRGVPKNENAIGSRRRRRTIVEGFLRKYRAEMKTPDNRALLATLAALSHESDFSVGTLVSVSHARRS